MSLRLLPEDTEWGQHCSMGGDPALDKKDERRNPDGTGIPFALPPSIRDVSKRHHFFAATAKGGSSQCSLLYSNIL